MRGAGRALGVLAMLCLTSAESVQEVLNPDFLPGNRRFDELLHYYNEPQDTNCQWYKRYPFNAGIDDPVPVCLEANQCTNMHNPSNVNTGTTGPCRRPGSEMRAYTTVARIPPPIHLTVTLFGKNEATRALDAHWEGDNGLNLRASWQNGVLRPVPPTAFAATTVDENDFDTFYTDAAGRNQWQSKLQWPGAFTERNNVCQSYQITKRIAAGAPSDNPYEEEVVDTWYVPCLASDDYAALISAA